MSRPSLIVTCGELWLERAAAGGGGSARSSARRNHTRLARATPSAAARLVRARTAPPAGGPIAARAPRLPSVLDATSHDGRRDADARQVLLGHLEHVGAEEGQVGVAAFADHSS